MKKILLGIFVLVCLFSACDSTNKQSDNKATNQNDHSGHDDHDHDHDNEHHSGHDHSIQGKDGHSVPSHDEDELVDNDVAFSDEQAKRVNLTLEKVTPKPFYQIIKTSGQLTAPVGEEITIVASTSGIIKFT